MGILLVAAWGDAPVRFHPLFWRCSARRDPGAKAQYLRQREPCCSVFSVADLTVTGAWIPTHAAVFFRLGMGMMLPFCRFIFGWLLSPTNVWGRFCLSLTLPSRGSSGSLLGDRRLRALS